MKRANIRPDGTAQHACTTQRSTEQHGMSDGTEQHDVEYVPVADAARRLGINGHAVRQRAYRGSLPYRRDGKVLLVGLPPQDEKDAARETARTPPKTARETTRRTARVLSDETQVNTEAEVMFLRERLAARDAEMREMRTGYERQISELHVMLQQAQRQLPATIDAPAPPERHADDLRQSAPHVAPDGVQRVPDSLWERLRRALRHI